MAYDEHDQKVVTSDLPLTAFAIAKHSVTLVDHNVTPDGKVFFILIVPKEMSFSQIETDFLGNGRVGGISYSEAIRALKRIVVHAKKSKGVIL